MDRKLNKAKKIKYFFARKSIIIRQTPLPKVAGGKDPLG